MIHRLKKQLKRLNVQKLLYPVLSLFSHKKHRETAEHARQVMEEYSPQPLSDAFAENKVVRTPAYDLQIIIPAYNAQQYITECLNSIVNQRTAYSYKIVVIDDGSTDRTAELLEAFDNENITIIHQENKGFSGARNTGLKEIDSSYIMFVDSDDKLAEDAVQVLLQTAIENNADIVQGGNYEWDGDLLTVHNSFPDSTQLPKNKLTGYPWGKVMKSRLFENLCFPEHYLFEDTIFSFLVNEQADVICSVSQIVYYYRVNWNSISHTVAENPRSIETVWITEMLLEMRKSLLYRSDTKEFYEIFMKQVILNYKRTKQLPECVQKSIFVVHAQMLRETFSQSFGMYKPLFHSLYNDDYGRYRLYCMLA